MIHWGIMEELGDEGTIQRRSGDVTERDRGLIARLRPQLQQIERQQIERQQIERQHGGAFESAERIERVLKSSFVKLRRLLAVSLVLPAVACATARSGRAAAVDLARQAFETAQQAGAAEKAPGNFQRAEAYLKKAEKEPSAAAARDDALKAELLARIATIEARCALSTEPAGRAAERAARTSEAEIAERLQRSEEQRRRQEEHITLLLRDLDVAEAEIIRTKARLKGLETKAEASSAIAEARILIGRLDPTTRAASLTSAEEAIAKAEELLQEENYGAAFLFAAKAQDIARPVP
jgi:hypothetical protein